MIERDQLRCGIFLPPFHPNDEDPLLCFERDFELMQHLDKLGFHEAWIGEHHSGGYETYSSPELFIATAAERTKHIRLGTGVISLPYHNPLMVANRMIQLDHMTRGRVMFGAGPGLLASDALMLGIDPTVQRDRMVQALDVILRLFAGETVTETTDWYTLVEARVHLLPFTQPRPETVVASALTPSGGRIAGRYGLGMLCVAIGIIEGVDILKSNWEIACQTAKQHGREMDRKDLRVLRPMHIAETRAEAAAQCREGLQSYLDYMNNNSQRYEVPAGGDAVDWWNSNGHGVIGTPDDAIAAIQEIYDTQGEFGCVLNLPNNIADWPQTKRSFELYANHVMPHFRGSNAARIASYNWVTDHHGELGRKRDEAIRLAVAKHQAEEAAGAE
jgi:limonene 1,2-monooxygenase